MLNLLTTFTAFFMGLYGCNKKYDPNNNPVGETELYGMKLFQSIPNSANCRPAQSISDCSLESIDKFENRSEYDGKLRVYLTACEIPLKSEDEESIQRVTICVGGMPQTIGAIKVIYKGKDPVRQTSVAILKSLDEKLGKTGEYVNGDSSLMYEYKGKNGEYIQAEMGPYLNVEISLESEKGPDFFVYGVKEN